MKILLVDDEEDMSLVFSSIARDENIEVRNVDTAEQGIEIAGEDEIGAVFLDLRLPGMDGLEALRQIKGRYPDLPVTIITGHETIETAVEAIKVGAYDYLVKPIPLEKLKVAVRNAAKLNQLCRRVRSLQEKVEGKVTLENIIGSSPKMRELFDSVRRIAGLDVMVLLLGETGTGKEMVSHAIHWESDRRNKPFMPIDCAALHENLFESELFGHEKGAFTGASKQHIGRLEMAHGGTVFLDEVGNIPLQLQAKLLRVVERGEIIRVGGKEFKRVDVRIICATNADLEQAVSEGKFREDLYHRINVFPICLPPLRERTGDIETLAMFFLEKYNRELKKNVRRIAVDAITILNGYDWPGNVRELENVIKRAVIMASAEVLPSHLAIGLRKEKGVEKEKGEEMTLRNFRKSVEKPFIQEMLARHQWNKRKVAQILEIDNKTLLSRIRQYGS